jgi:eukaryotic-like serine/threonine-protein kinase
MATVLPNAERGLEMQATRISVEPPSELPQSQLPASARRPYGPGDMIDGKYALESLLGRGGMGEVWTAHNATLGVRRAVKLLRADAGSADSTDRLLNEAQAAARLVDPSIVRVFDFGKTSSGDPYIVMEMLEGEDLMSVIRRRERLSPIKAVRVLLPMIRALVGAHAHGIVHRDLKPENIFLAKLPDGRVQPKLLDFGIAKLRNAIGLRLTTDGAVMGSPLYMAPEQSRGEDVDERADIWALSVVLYESITGQPPFTGDDRFAVSRAVSESSPARLSQHNVTDESLWPILSRGLEKRREDRWASMEELGRALARWLLEQGVIDDITGASLEAGWFRSRRQSLFGSSSPPQRSSLAGPDVKPAPLLPVSIERSPRDRLGVFLRALLARAARGLDGLRATQRSRRLGFGLAFALGAAITITWTLFTELDGAAAPEPPAPRDLASALAADSLPSGPTPIEPALDEATALDEAHAPEVAPPGPGDGPSPARAPSRDPARVRRKPMRGAESAPSDASKEQRRSKLIDPYR